MAHINVGLFVCLSQEKITQKVVNRFSLGWARPKDESISFWGAVHLDLAFFVLYLAF